MSSCFELHSNPKIRSFLSPGHRHSHKSFSISNSHKNLRELFPRDYTIVPKTRIKIDEYQRKKFQSPPQSKIHFTKTHQNSPKYYFLQKNEQQKLIEGLKKQLKQLGLQNQKLKFQQSTIEKLLKDKDNLIFELQARVRAYQFKQTTNDFVINTTVRRNLECSECSLKQLRTGSTFYEEIRKSHQIYEQIKKERDRFRQECLRLSQQCLNYQKQIEEYQTGKKNVLTNQRNSIEIVRTQLQNFDVTLYEASDLPEKNFLRVLSQIGIDRNREIDEINLLLSSVH